mmetsp:Transcript_21865/g.44164  ORF Transcript_21865/g.44164 Transcript_21865/m.44164 type:complete len:132 (-) Transcript_21865:195-590(-)
MFLLLLLIAIENGCVGLVANRAPHLFERYGDYIEIGTASAVFLFWAAFHIWFVFYVRHIRTRETRELSQLQTASEAAKERYLEQREAQSKRSNSTNSNSRREEAGSPPNHQQSANGYVALREAADEKPLYA